MKQFLVQDKNQAIAIDSMDVAKGKFNPFLVANYVDYDNEFKPIGGGQKAHEKYITWYNTYLPIAEKAFSEAVAELQKTFAKVEKGTKLLYFLQLLYTLHQACPDMLFLHTLQ